VADLVPALALGVVAILLAMAITVAWRIARWWVRTRRVLAYRAAIADVTGRAEALLGPIADRADLVRRGSLDPTEILPELARGISTSERLAVETRRLRGPAGSHAVIATIADELERAGRAMAGMEYGCRLTVDPDHRGYDPDAQTAIKRGYLNLAHARESIAYQAASVAAMEVGRPRLVVPRDVD
jgi:hypothetical protein